MKRLRIEFKIFILFIIATAVVLTFGIAAGKGKLLVMQNNTTGQKIEFYLPQRQFSLGYMHSVMKTPAEEFFRINKNNEIVLEKTVYESFGVGLPFLADGNDFEIEDGKFILKTNYILKEINMIISPIPEHWLRIGDMKYELMDILKVKNSSITIYASNISIIRNLSRLFNNQ